MNKKKILIYEKYDGVRFVLERILSKYDNGIVIFSSHIMKDITSRIQNDHIDLLITELSTSNPDGLEISLFARTVSPQLNIMWITVLGCHFFRDQLEQLGNITCIEKPLEIKQIRNSVLRSLEIPH